MHHVSFACVHLVGSGVGVLAGDRGHRLVLSRLPVRVPFRTIRVHQLRSHVYGRIVKYVSYGVRAEIGVRRDAPIQLAYFDPHQFSEPNKLFGN